MTALLVLRMQADPKRRDVLDGAILEALAAVRRSSGSLWADAGASIEDPEGVTMLAEWRTDADLAAFRDGPEWQELLDRCEVAIRESPSLRRFHA